MALPVKLSLADRTSLRKAHRTNAAIFIDQRLFLRRVYRVVFFSTWMDAVFSLGVLRVVFFGFDVPFFARSTTSHGHFLHRSTSFFGDERIELRFFSTCMEGRFPHSIHFESFFSLLDQRPFLAESISSHRLFSARSVFFNIRCYKPVALFSVMFCTTLKYPNFRLKSVCIHAIGLK